MWEASSSDIPWVTCNKRADNQLPWLTRSHHIDVRPLEPINSPPPRIDSNSSSIFNGFALSQSAADEGTASGFIPSGAGASEYVDSGYSGSVGIQDTKAAAVDGISQASGPWGTDSANGLQYTGGADQVQKTVWVHGFELDIDIDELLNLEGYVEI